MRWRVVAIDVVLAVASFGVSALVLSNSRPVAADLRSPDVAGYLLLAVYSGSVAIRHRAPAVAVFAGLLAGIAYAAAQYPVAVTPIVLLPVYTAAAVLPQRRARQLLVAAVALGWVGATLSPGPTDVGVPALIVAAWVLGNYLGTRRAYTAELEEKNRQLERAQLDLADQAVAEERLRIARELHDVVAHTMSVVAMHAGTGRMVAASDPGAAGRSLATIETATRSALLEMRQLLGVLRGSDGERPGSLAPAPGLHDVDTLVAEVVRSGVTVEMRVEGERPDLPAGIDLSAYRIVQEALTNVIKHAGPARATVVIGYAADAVTLDIDDDGPARPPATAGSGGHGLVGMRERVAMYNGDLIAGPLPGGGFRVHARLPLGGRA